MKQYIVKEFTGFVEESLFDSDKSVEEWINDVIMDNQKNEYLLETLTQSMLSINGGIHRSVILVMSKEI